MFKDSIKKLYKKFMKKSYKLFFNREYKYLTVSPKPSDEEIEKYYLSEFYNNAHKDNKKGLPDSSLIKQKKDKEFHEIRFKDMFNNIKEIKGKIKKSSILDIGCGYGEFLSYMKKQKLDCYGLELSEDAIDYIKKFKKGIKIKQFNITKGLDGYGKKKFDIISLLSVLEHSQDPIKLLKSINKILNKNGILIIDVPNDFNAFQLAAVKKFKIKKYWFFPPRHLNYFSLKSLRHVLKKCKFKIKIAQSSFPLEMFLLFGDNYIRDKKMGPLCHDKRFQFEKNLIKTGNYDLMKRLYRSLAELGLGRQICIYAKKQ